MIIVVGFGVAGTVFGFTSSLVQDEPVRSKEEIVSKIEENAITGFVYFNDDTQLGQLRSDEDRRLVEYHEIPQLVLDAVLAVEDANFFEHIGVDVNGLFRAVKERLLNEERQTGGSTLTQQLAKIVFLSPEVELDRKAKEIFLSVRMERMLSKEQILAAYLNKVPFGTGANGYNIFGIKAAAKGIFGIDNLDELNIAQSAYLAGLPQSPSAYSAFKSNAEFDETGFQRAESRKERVLRRMLEVEKITQAQYNEALAFDIRSSMAEPQVKAYTTYPNLMIEVEKRAAEVLLSLLEPDIYENRSENPEAYAEAYKDALQELSRGGYRVYTTIDKTIYDAMQEIANEDSHFLPDHPEAGIEQVGAIMLDNKTGAIIGMIEGRRSSFNHATQAYRQPGSAMKPIAAFVPAMEKGAIQPAGVIDDTPVILKHGNSGYHIPENWNRRFHGLITAREAFNQSYNIPAIKLFLNEVGIEEAWAFAQELGINSFTEQDYHAQTGVIGGLTKGVTVEELTNAYTAIANKGKFNDAHLIRKIENSEGKLVYEYEPLSKQVFSAETAYLMTDMMRTVITSGTGTDIRSFFKNYGNIPVVGKTGSTQEDADAWFVGYSPDITVGVWVGYADQRFKLSASNGSTKHAMKVWSLVMDSALEKKPELFATAEFERPDDIVSMTVSNLSGKLPNELVKQQNRLVTDLFNRKYVPTEEDDVLVRMKYVIYDGVNYLPHESTPEDMLWEQTVINRPESVGSILQQIQEVMGSIPANRQRPLSAYVPRDAGTDAPSVTDPRSDDGKAPDPPTELVMTRSGDTNTISFSPSPSGDVVGYRLYRSDGENNFQRVAGQVVRVGEENVFSGMSYSFGSGYYVTAVDVAGNESAPSRIVFNDSINPDLILPGEDRGDDDENNGGNGRGNSEDDNAGLQAPRALRVEEKGQALRFTWTSQDNIDQFHIYYSTSEQGPYKRIGSSDAQDFVYYSSDDLDGFYRVTAVRNGEESPASPAVKYES